MPPNPDSSFRDADGFPWALLVPADWEHPAEGQRIEEKYPRFTDWRLSEGESDRDWYVTTPPSDKNQPPYPVTATDPPDEDPSTPEVDLSFNQFPLSPDTVQLIIEEDAEGKLDPDGDAVFYRAAGTLPDYLELDETTGLITIDNGDTKSDVTVDFYSEDEHGAATDGEPLVVNFTFGSS